jgi:hypothetical protein
MQVSGQISPSGGSAGKNEGAHDRISSVYESCAKQAFPDHPRVNAVK